MKYHIKNPIGKRLLKKLRKDILPLELMKNESKRIESSRREIQTNINDGKNISSSMDADIG